MTQTSVEYSKREIEEALKKIFGHLGRHFQEQGYVVEFERMDSGVLKFAITKNGKIVAAIIFMDLAGKLSLGVGGERKLITEQIKNILIGELGYTISPEDEGLQVGALFTYPAK